VPPNVGGGVQLDFLKEDQGQHIRRFSTEFSPELMGGLPGPGCGSACAAASCRT
jgi:hypothetical protein